MTEDAWEQLDLDVLVEPLMWQHKRGAQIAPGSGERETRDELQVMEESATVTRHNLVRQRAFSERLTELMTKYTNSQLTAAEVIAAMIELAREVSA